MSAVAMSQSLSLNEYYSDFLTVDNYDVVGSEYTVDSVSVAEKISLPQYYAEYLK